MLHMERFMGTREILPNLSNLREPPHQPPVILEGLNMQQSLSQWMRDLSTRVNTQVAYQGDFIRAQPLGRQIDRWLAETPPALLARPWSMAELQKLFVGRYRQRAHAQHIASELRKRGWVTLRIWSDPGYGTRVWLPTTKIT